MEYAMLIILCLYIVAVWAIFSKFKLVRWGWASGSVAVLVGLLILATFLALFNYLTPSGRLTVTGRVVEVTPNVSGQITAIPVKPNVLLKSDEVLFQIDPAPFQHLFAMSDDELSLRIIGIESGVDQGDEVAGARQLKLRTTRGEIPLIVHAAETPGRAVLCISGAIGGFDGPAKLYARLGLELPALGITVVRLNYRMPNEFGECVLDTMAGLPAA